MPDFFEEKEPVATKHLFFCHFNHEESLPFRLVQMSWEDQFPFKKRILIIPFLNVFHYTLLFVHVKAFTNPSQFQFASSFIL